MPADIKEYTNCYDVIQRALLARDRRASAATEEAPEDGGSSFLPTPLLIVLGVLVVAAIGFGILALRQRSGRRSSWAPSPTRARSHRAPKPLRPGGLTHRGGS